MNLDFEEILSFSIKSLKNNLKAFIISVISLALISTAFIYYFSKTVYSMQFSANSSYLTNSDITTKFESLQSLIDLKNSEALSQILGMSIDEVNSIKGVKAVPHDKTSNYGNLKITLIGSKKEVLEAFPNQFREYLLTNDYIKQVEALNRKQTEFTIEKLKKEIEEKQDLDPTANFINISNNNIVEMLNTLNNAEKKLATFSAFSLTDSPTTSSTSSSLLSNIVSIFLFSFIGGAFLIIFTTFSKNYYKRLLEK
jgi:hypothetical protein